MKTANVLVAMMLAATPPAPAAAALYRCAGAAATDPPVFTNLIDAAQATRRKCQPVQRRSSPLDAAAPPAPVAAASALQAKVRVSAPVQRQRDAERRQILAAELRDEEALLARLQRQAQAAPDSGDAQAQVARHLVDIEALRRELARTPAP